MNAKISEKLQQYTQEDWNYLIRGVLFENENYNWLFSVGDSPGVILMNIYRSLNAVKGENLLIFFNSCLYNLKVIPKIISNAKQLYTLIYILHETRPVEQRNKIFQVVSGNELANIEYQGYNLEQLLAKTFIQMENQETCLLGEWIYSKPLSGYYLYLRVLYFSQVLDYANALRDICVILKGEVIISEKDTFILFNTLRDIFPRRISFKTFLIYLHTNTIEISEESRLNETLNKALYFWQNSIGDNEFYQILITHLDDYFNKTCIMTIVKTSYLENLINYDAELCNYISRYYRDYGYNNKPFVTAQDLLQSTINEMSHGFPKETWNG